MCERHFVLRADVQHRYHIRGYCRFKDDILLIIGGTLSSRASFLEEFRRRSRFFALKVDCVSSSSAEMLDITIFKGPSWRNSGMLDHTLFTKPTSIWLPLSPDSNHPVGVHVSWPRGHLNRIKRLCPDRETANSEVEKFLGKFQEVARRFCELFRMPATSRKSTPPVSNRIVFPFHPI